MANKSKQGSGCVIAIVITAAVGAVLFIGFIGLIWLATQMPTTPRSPSTANNNKQATKQAVIDRDPSVPSEIEKPTKQTAVPQISDEIKQIIVDHFVLNFTDVRDVFIGQEHDDIKIAIIVSPGTTRIRAKEIGENAVRLIKSLSDDDSPGKLIGQGIYDYRIAVGTSDENIMIQGAKNASAISISW
ncbi:MAG: hypothetical protein IH984_08300 [Planctomycetes bacterium]|nr:hypothetical protein [Planctomycetota bacterium]